MTSRSNRVRSMNQQGWFVALLFLIGNFACAEDKPLTLGAALRESLAANPMLKAEFHRVQAANLIGIQRGALPDPKLSYTEFLSSVETRTGPQERIVSLSQMTPWPGKLKLAREIADSKARQAFRKYEATRLSTIEETGSLYFEYAYLAVAEKIAKENQELLEQLKPVVKERVRGGGNLASSLRLDVEIARVEDQTQTIQQQRPAISSRFAKALGRRAGVEPIPYPVFPSTAPKLADIEKLLPHLENHPLVLATREGVIAADQAVKLAAKSGQPDLSFGVNVIEIGQGGDAAVGATVGVSLPFSRKKYKAEKQEAIHLAEAARATTEDVQLELITRLHVAYQAWEESRKRLELYDDKLIPSSKQAVELTAEAFRNNKSTLTDLIDTERTLLQLQLERAAALKNAHQSSIAVRALVGDLEIESKTSSRK